MSELITPQTEAVTAELKIGRRVVRLEGVSTANFSKNEFGEESYSDLRYLAENLFPPGKGLIDIVG